MKTILMTAVAAATLIATPAFAQTFSEIELNATVASKCGSGHHISGDGGVAAGYTTGHVNFGELTDNNGQINAPVLIGSNRSFGNLWCNYAAPVKLEVSALTNDETVYDHGSFTNVFDIQVVTDAGVYFGQGENYTLRSLNGVTGVTTPVNTAGAFETGTGRYGSLATIHVLPKARSAGGNYRPISGDYTGYVRFTVGSN